MAKSINRTGFRYINPLTDFGFKRIFGDKEVMRAFLTDLLQPESPIKDIVFLDKELAPDNDKYRGVIYDLRCTTSDGGEFIVEMQNRGQEHFSDRIIYYLSRSFSRQQEAGEKWNYKLRPVYGVFFLNFHMTELKPRYLRTIQMTVSETGELFTDKMKAFTLELPDFKDKPEDYPKNKVEYWLYILANMYRFDGQLPFSQEQPVFKRVGRISEIANLSPDDLYRYEKVIDTVRTNNEVMSFAKKEGREEGLKEGLKEGLEKGLEKGLKEGLEKGLEKGLKKGLKEGLEKGLEKGRMEGRMEGQKEGIIKVAQSMKAMGLSLSQIMQATGLTEEEIERVV